MPTIIRLTETDTFFWALVDVQYLRVSIAVRLQKSIAAQKQLLLVLFSCWNGASWSSLKFEARDLTKNEERNIYLLQRDARREKLVLSPGFEQSQRLNSTIKRGVKLSKTREDQLFASQKSFSLAVAGIPSTLV